MWIAHAEETFPVKRLLSTNHFSKLTAHSSLLKAHCSKLIAQSSLLKAHVHGLLDMPRTSRYLPSPPSTTRT